MYPHVYSQAKCVSTCVHTLTSAVRSQLILLLPLGTGIAKGKLPAVLVTSLSRGPQPPQTISTVSFAQKHTGEKGSDIRRVSTAFPSTWWGLPPRLRGLRICLLCRRWGFDPWVRKLPLRRKWQPTLVFLPENCHGQRSLVGYSPWGCKESDMTEWPNTNTPI